MTQTVQIAEASLASRESDIQQAHATMQQQQQEQEARAKEVEAQAVMVTEAQEALVLKETQAIQRYYCLVVNMG